MLNTASSGRKPRAGTAANVRRIGTTGRRSVFAIGRWRGGAQGKTLKSGKLKAGHGGSGDENTGRA